MLPCWFSVLQLKLVVFSHFGAQRVTKWVSTSIVPVSLALAEHRRLNRLSPLFFRSITHVSAFLLGLHFADRCGNSSALCSELITQQSSICDSPESYSRDRKCFFRKSCLFLCSVKSCSILPARFALFVWWVRTFSAAIHQTKKKHCMAVHGA